MKPTRLVIDADYLCYAAGFAVERKRYAVVAPVKDAEQAPQLLAAGVDYEAARALSNVVEGCELYTKQEAEPLENALLVVRAMLRDVYKQVAERFDSKPDIVLLLTGYSNFRERIAAVARYKYNRVEKAKPKHYGAIRKYLVDERGAQIVHWYEADDEASILLTEDRAGTVVASIDKDLLQVPGWHFVPEKGFINVTPSGGLMRFYGQALSGDSTDGVPGCFKTGDKGAQKVLLAAAKGCTTLSELERKLWAAVLETYRKSKDKYGEQCPYDNPDTAALETARLVYMLRQRPANLNWIDLWEPPT